MEKLTKTDFIQYLNCEKSLWVLKHDPANFPHGEFSTFLQKLTREGYEVEDFVRQFFESDISRSVNFQTTFETEDGLFARADVLEKLSNGEVILYEVKSSTSVKTDPKHNHLKDACFQKICSERAGQKIDRVCMVHLNKDYIKEGNINPEDLLVFEDVTDRVREIYGETEAEIDEALAFLRELEIDTDNCSCLRKSRVNQCDTFGYFNAEIPKLSIYSLPRLSEKKRLDLINKGIFDLKDVPSDYTLSDIQSGVLRSVHQDAPQIDVGAVNSILEMYEFPLYFFDYETFGSAVPLVDGSSPHKQFPVQYSLHILKEDGSLTHKEFLQREARLPANLVEQMELDFGPEGSIVSWHASFEKARNREMASWFPDKVDFLNDLNDRMVDLEEIFKKAYVDARFDGSTSIKKVLPILCPDLGYDDLAVQDGAAAMDAWQRMLGASGNEADAKAQELLAYCKLDTLAMVEIYKFLMRTLQN